VNVEGDASPRALKWTVHLTPSALGGCRTEGFNPAMGVSGDDDFDGGEDEAGGGGCMVCGCMPRRARNLLFGP